MESFSKIAKKIGIEVTTAAIGIACVGTFGFSAIGISNGEKKEPVTTSTAKIQTLAEDTVQSAANVQTQKLDIVKFRKASIDEYDMTEAKSTSTKKKTTTAQKKKTTENSDPASFAVAFPDGEPSHYDIKNDPANFSETRSIAKEYYTVHDIISGKTVTMNAHDLICSMVYSEIGDGWGDEAIKAQTVAAYSCLRFNDSIGAIETVGLKTNYTSRIENLVSSVEGQVMYYDGSIINAAYSASTAGFSTTSADIWGVSYPYLQCVKSEFDNEDPNWGIESSFTKSAVKKILEDKYDIKLSDDVTNWIKVNSTHSGKYITTASIDSQLDVSGTTLCNLFSVKSNAMDISYEDGVFTFTSYGWGHGVGMSQWGACLYAQHGYTYDQILTHYYVNTYIGLSDENSKAVSRGNKSEEQLESEAGTAVTTTTPAETTTAQTTTTTEATTTEPTENSES